MPLREIARGKESLVTAGPDASIRDVAKRMADEKVGSVIIERNDEPVGIITDRDITVSVVAEGKDFVGMTARDVMTRDPITAEADDGVYQLCQKMRKHGIRRMPITDDDKLVGIVTLDDLVILLEDEMRDLSDVVRAESPPY